MLPQAGERAELAMNLWESLSTAEREAELALSPAQAAELDRRWKEHLEGRNTAVPWDEVRRKQIAQPTMDETSYW